MPCSPRRQKVHADGAAELTAATPAGASARNASPTGGRSTLHFPDNTAVTDTVHLGDPIQSIFFGRPRPGRLVLGPWSAALSAFAGQPLQLVATEDGQTGVDRGVAGGGSPA